MPLMTFGDFEVDFTDESEGEPVILVHSSGSSNRQWRSLTELLSQRYRVLAINRFGYGSTTPWPGREPQTLADQADLVVALAEWAGRPVRLVGHSFGAVVALKAATLLGPRSVDLVLLDPSPFYVLAQHGRWEAYNDVCTIRDYVKTHGAVGDWQRVAERFADFWVGEGTWKAMSPNRQKAFAQTLPNNFHEWDAVMAETAPMEEWRRLPARTLVVHSAQNQRLLLEIFGLFREVCSHWTFVEIAAGHMAPVTHPEIVNPIIKEFLDEGSS